MLEETLEGILFDAETGDRFVGPRLRYVVGSRSSGACRCPKHH